MPTSSRATNTGDGNQDSYLKRYYRSLPEGKRWMIEKSLMNAVNEQAHVSGLEKGHVGCPTQVPDPQKTAVEHRNGADAEDSEGNNPKEPSSKKSSTCIVL